MNKVMKDSIRRSLRKRLLSLMREISQEYFCAGWMIGLEYELWRAVLRYPQPSEALLGFIEQEEVAELKDLADHETAARAASSLSPVNNIRRNHQ
ncbi:MAG: hypothetical protein M3X11_11715 [Acidobacteriota bacterium]|nr:hypothetical protein [Acidobacteriota bacterium]